MNLRSLPIFAALALTPVALAAQTPAAEPLLYAAVAAPTSISSSNSPEDLASSSIRSDSTQAAAAPVVTGSSIPFTGLAVAVKFGVAGIGFDVATPLIRQWLNLRGGASFFSYTPSTFTQDNLNIDGHIKMQNADIMVDVFPFHGRVRLSGGLTVYNDTGLTATLVVPNGQSITVGGTDYYSDPTHPLHGNGIFTLGGNKVVPRVTIGTGNMIPKKGRFTFQSELGIQYITAPTVAYNFSGNGCNDKTYTNCAPIPQQNVIDEQNKLQNDLYDLRFYPILSVGLSYRIH
jgi:hypothetical protein